MSYQDVNTQFAQSYAHLFDHSGAIRKETEYFFQQFEGNQRHTEFDQLLKTSHHVNEAIESETAERMKALDMQKLTGTIDAVSTTLERLVQKAEKQETVADDYVDAVKSGQTDEWERLEKEIATKRAEVDEQVEKHIEETKKNYAEALQKQQVP